MPKFANDVNLLFTSLDNNPSVKSFIQMSQKLY